MLITHAVQGIQDDIHFSWNTILCMGDKNRLLIWEIVPSYLYFFSVYERNTSNIIQNM